MSDSWTSRRVIVVGSMLLAALVASGCGDDGGEAADTADTSSGTGGDTGLAGMVRNPPLDVSAVTLPDVSGDGESMAMVAPDGELLLVYFGYTSCPDVCPTTMSDLTVALGDLPPELAERVTVAMGTVDPERDTDEVLTGYLDHFFDDGIALRTDDPAELRTATDAFGVQFEVAEHEPGEAYDVAHSAVTYVVDDTGTVVVEWPFGFESEAMTADITTLLTTNVLTSNVLTEETP